MAAHPKRIEIAPEDRPVLEKWANAQAVERRLADRARIVLMAAEGWPADVIAGLVGRSAETVRRQRASYERHGLDGLRDRPKTGRPLTHGHEVRAKLIALACTRPPDTPEGVRRERWTHAELAAQVGMSQSQAHEILRNADVRPHLTQYWVMSELGPDFDAQAAEVCGLYLDPPAGAIVVSVDEKTSIAARQPARPDVLPAPGRPARRDSEYLRNGTTNLFAALQVHSGTVAGMTAPTRNQWDFIAFLDQLETEIPSRQAGHRDPRQPLHPQDPERAGLAGRAPTLEDGLHAQTRLVAEPGRDLLLDPHPPPTQARPVHRTRRPRHPDARLRRTSQPHRPTIRVDIQRQSTRSMTNNTYRTHH